MSFKRNNSGVALSYPPEAEEYEHELSNDVALSSLHIDFQEESRYTLRKPQDSVDLDGVDAATFLNDADRERFHRVYARRHPTNKVAKVFNSVIPYGGILASGLTLSSSSIGAGIISLPQACQTAGMAMCILYLVIVGALTILSYVLLGEAGKQTGLRNYAQVTQALMGTGSNYFLCFCLWFLSYGAEVSYVISLCDVVQGFLANGKGVSTVWKSASGVRLVTFFVWLVAMWPLILPLEINSLRYFSVIAVLFIVYFVIAMIIHCCANDFDGADKIVAFQTGNSAVEGLGVIMFSYISQLNCFEVYEELYKPSVKRLTYASMLSTLLCFTLYLCASVFGYLDFGPAVTGSSLLLYNPVEDTYMTVAYAGIIVKLCVGYGLHMIPVRESVYHVFKIDSKVFPWWKNALVVTVLGGTSMALGLILPKVSVIFGLVGGFSGGFIGYIFPALMYMYTGCCTWKNSPLLFIGTYVLLLAGVIGVVFGSVPSFYSLAVNGM